MVVTMELLTSLVLPGPGRSYGRTPCCTAVCVLVGRPGSIPVYPHTNPKKGVHLLSTKVHDVSPGIKIAQKEPQHRRSEWVMRP